VHEFVSALAGHLPSLAGMPQSERDAIHRVELDRMAKASEAMLARHQVSDASHIAHVMTLSCDRVIKDVIRSAPESFSDGRLERALCRLCLDFVRSE
jgi:hypothetical protein